MSDDKNYFIPATYINSERYYQNKTNVNGITDIETYNLKKWFLGEENVKFLIKKLFINYLNIQCNYIFILIKVYNHNPYIKLITHTKFELKQTIFVKSH